MNSLNFVGNIGRDAETKFLTNGDAITSFSAALSSGYGDKKITTWLNCSMFGKRGEAVSQYLKKGTQVAISGEFAARPYKSKDGIDKLSLDVRVNDLTLVGGKKDSAQDSHSESKSNGYVEQKQSQGGADFKDIPFAHHGKCGAGVSWRAM